LSWIHPEWPSDEAPYYSGYDKTQEWQRTYPQSREIKRHHGSLNRNEQMGRYRSFAETFLSDAQIGVHGMHLSLEGVNDILQS
jgi:hypothetical protein